MARGGHKTHFAIFGEIDLERLGVVLEPKRGHGEENVFSIDRLALLLLTFFGRCATLVNYFPPRWECAAAWATYLRS